MGQYLANQSPNFSMVNCGYDNQMIINIEENPSKEVNNPHLRISLYVLFNKVDRLANKNSICQVKFGSKVKIKSILIRGSRTTCLYFYIKSKVYVRE